MQKEYFVRFVRGPEQAQADLERGFSFSDYVLFDSPEDVIEYFGGDEDDDSGLDLADLAQDNFGETAGKWGVSLNGLCGFGSFDSVEDAEDYARENRGYNGVSWPAAAIFEGRPVDDEKVWDGDCFKPIAVVKSIHF